MKLNKRLERLEGPLRLRRLTAAERIQKAALELLSDRDLELLRDLSKRGAPFKATREEQEAIEHYEAAYRVAGQGGPNQPSAT